MPALSLLATLRYHSGPVWSVQWSPRGLLASCGADRRVLIWNTNTGTDWTLVTTSPTKAFLRAVRHVSWAPDGRSLAAASFDASATVLELSGGQQPKLEPVVCLEGHDAEVKSVAYSSGGGLLATCSRDRSVWIWHVGLDFDYDCIAVLNSHRGDVKRVVWHPQIEMLVSCSFDQSVRVWVEDEDDWFCSEELMAHSSTVWDVSFDDTGDGLATISADMSLIIWRREAPPPSVVGATPRYVVSARVDNLSTEPLYSVDWLRGQEIIAVGGGDDSIHILRKSQDCEMEVQPAVKANTSGPSELTSPTEGQGNSTTRLTEKWEVVCTQSRAHTGDVNCVSWCPTHPKLLASCGDDGLVRIWQYED